MENIDDAALDALVAERQVDEYGAVSIVTVPEWSGLTSTQKSQVLAKVQRAHAQTPLDATALDHALRQLFHVSCHEAEMAPHSPSLRDWNTPQRESMDADVPTPPLDPNEYLAAETAARTELEIDGSIPCYPDNIFPPDLEHPFREVPEEYRDIIHFWTRSDAPGYGRPALAQLQDWKKWRWTQAHIRRKYEHEAFDHFVDAVRRRRRQFGVTGEVQLKHDVAQQNQLDNFLEYQDFHFSHHLRLQRDLAQQEKDLDDQPQEVDIYHYRILSRKQAIARHEVLLLWIERNRVALSTSLNLSDCHSDDTAPVVRQPSKARLQRRRHKTAGSVGVSKPICTRREHGRRHKLPGMISDTLSALPVVKQPRYPSDVTTLQVRKLRDREPQTPDAFKRPPTQIGIRAKAGQSPNAATEIRTRSGRLSRKPVRWSPHLW
ncbi:hypothetical protein LTR17_019975 [Elasticomyces elasticus]|nr:hypothetical protein LTR17_019975 [Elasticomyces elasticus]